MDELLLPFDLTALNAFCECIRYDANGHGENSCDAVGAQRWPALAEQQLGFLQNQRDFLGGQSMGAASALLAGISAEQRAEQSDSLPTPAGLILVTPPTLWDQRSAQADKWAKLGKLLLKPNASVLRMLMQISPPLPQYLLQDKEKIELYCAHLQQQSERSAGRLQRVLEDAAASNLPPKEDLHCELPALILAWENDPTHPVSSALALAERLPNADVQIAGSLEEVTRWSESIERFMRENI
jgi:pimeloyl-ACP methyl ester carboxylesterase